MFIHIWNLSNQCRAVEDMWFLKTFFNCSTFSLPSMHFPLMVYITFCLVCVSFKFTWVDILFPFMKSVTYIEAEFFSCWLWGHLSQPFKAPSSFNILLWHRVQKLSDIWCFLVWIIYYTSIHHLKFSSLFYRFLKNVYIFWRNLISL